MNLLPLQIILGLQIAAAAVIFIQLMAGEGTESSLRPKKRVALRSRSKNY
jgi:hypothetical protein